MHPSYDSVKLVYANQYNSVKVYQARHHYLKTPVAIKTADKTDADGMHCLTNEAELQRQLSHSRYVPRIIDAFETTATVCMSTEWWAAGNVEMLVRSHGRLTETHAKEIFEDLVEAIHDAHAANICHRDIKPGNVFLRMEGTQHRAALGDFGLATQAKEGEHLTCRTGTPATAAPEVIGGRGYDRRCDMWSAGCVLFYMLTGTMPFLGNDRQTMYDAMRGQVDWSLLPTISEETEALVRGLLTVEVSHRLTLSETRDRAKINYVPNQEATSPTRT